MSEFKGTNGKWCVNKYLNIYSAAQRICYLEEVKFISDEEKKANALLISKAPELLNEINESIKDLLCMQVSINEAMKTDCRWEGMYELLQNQIDRKKELIKSATEG